jgi:hypothetical protein
VSMVGITRDLLCERSITSDTIDLFLRETHTDGGHCTLRMFGYPVTMARIDLEPGQILDVLPVLKLRESEAQQLMDQLWRCGVRPTEGKGSAGQLAAVQAHLADMRELVAQKLKVALPVR